MRPVESLHAKHPPHRQAFQAPERHPDEAGVPKLDTPAPVTCLSCGYRQCPRGGCFARTVLMPHRQFLWHRAGSRPWLRRVVRTSHGAVLMPHRRFPWHRAGSRPWLRRVVRVSHGAVLMPSGQLSWYRTVCVLLHRSANNVIFAVCVCNI